MSSTLLLLSACSTHMQQPEIAAAPEPEPEIIEASMRTVNGVDSCTDSGDGIGGTGCPID